MVSGLDEPRILVPSVRGVSTQVVSQLQQPVYFIAGEQDKVMEPKYVRHLASFHKLFEGCGENVFEIPGCGHMAMVEQPEAVDTQIRQILANCETLKQ